MIEQRASVSEAACVVSAPAQQTYHRIHSPPETYFTDVHPPYGINNPVEVKARPFEELVDSVYAGYSVEELVPPFGAWGYTVENLAPLFGEEALSRTRYLQADKLEF